ncbi:MAG: Na/Pi cotransporter family protein [Candidatus Cyclonatronum sp.]|uniref:Na/Pi cotransporter family protein n=1 Tax=Cyclonatronum sp. TaxID=3024185 RepID=UPI0025BFCA36|nr:Na/Pi cotransporter family protein [Cyclonatronum sp.]MCC5932679.1 Na/Pi cotransporter family protein [Balneolales bacterium]MCH8487004.1 Na/Pi cotransporter family protein [Cyclonatronum sp.]
MTYTFFDFLQLVGALGIFIFGMKIFSDGLQKVAGSKLRSILKGMTRNRFTGVLTGFGTTTITQSSTTTTVMVVSFVNAGLLTFVESTGVIMGANIGTTVTAWMVAIFGFKFQITPIAVMMIGLFFPFLFVSNLKLRNIAEAMIGFGILFIGLDFIKDAVPDIDQNPEIFAFLDSFTDYGYLSLLLFVGVGTILTLLTQSSSAATAITLVMLFQGWISFPIAAAMILGENIGTTVTANIAALIGNVHAKRAARFHFFFNFAGVIWMLIVIYPFLNGIDWIMQQFSPGSLSVFSDDPAARPNATLALSLFHTTFNVLNVIFLFAFVPHMVRFVERIQPDKGSADDRFELKYINIGLMSSAELSIEQARKEISLFAKMVEKMHYGFLGLVYKKPEKQRKFLKKLEKREEITDQLEVEIAEYLVQISENTNVSSDSIRKIRNMQSMINDLERIGDLYFQMSKTYERTLDDEQEKVPDEALEELREMLSAVHDAIIIMKDNILSRTAEVDLQAAIDMERKIDEIRDRLRERHYARLEDGVYRVRSGIVYLDLLNRLEKIGDHIMNVSEAAAGKKFLVSKIEGTLPPVRKEAKSRNQ